MQSIPRRIKVRQHLLRWPSRVMVCACVKHEKCWKVTSHSGPATLRQMLARAQIQVSRYDVFASPAAEAALPRGAAEVALWRPGALGGLKIRGVASGTHPLALYSVRSVGPIKLGKSMVNPDRTAAFEVRATSSCSGCPPGLGPYQAAPCTAAHQALLSCRLWERSTFLERSS